MPAPMQDYQREFIDFMLKAEVLTFGDFTTKSGRKTPYFVNTGLYRTGSQLQALGRAYADAIESAFPDGFDVLFGPAYKGIPLVAAVSMAFAERGREVAFCFNRKEAKDHGEGGTLVGAPLEGRVLIIDDVITAGTAVREVMQIIQQAGATPAAVMIALDRQERGQGELSAIQEVERDFGIPVISIVSLNQVMDFIKDDAELQQHLPAVQAYRAEFGI